MARMIAVLILFIPGFLAAVGIKLMRDSLFDELYAILFNVGFQFLIGLVLFIGGLSFIGGYIVHRDRKRKLIRKKKKR